jgi:hypothetical protein
MRLAWAATANMGPNDVSDVVWAISTYFFFFFHVFLIITNGFILFRFYQCYKRTGGVRLGGDNKNGPKRCQTRRLGLRYVFFFIFVLFYLLLTNYFYYE